MMPFTQNENYYTQQQYIEHLNDITLRGIEMPRENTATEVARYPSKSNVGKEYIVSRHADGNLSCECLPWKTSKGTPKSCQHTRDVESATPLWALSGSTEQRLVKKVNELTRKLAGAEADRDSFEEMLNEASGAQEASEMLNVSLGMTVKALKIQGKQLAFTADNLMSFVDKRARFNPTDADEVAALMDEVVLNIKYFSAV